MGVTRITNAIEWYNYIAKRNGGYKFNLPENKDEFNKILKNSYINGKIGLQENKQIWSAVKK